MTYIGIIGDAADFRDEVRQCELHLDAIGPFMECLPLRADNENDDWLARAIDFNSVSE